MPTEVTVIIKGDDSTYRHKFLTYEPVTLQLDDPTLQELVAEAKTHYKGEIEEIKLRLAIEWM